MSHKTASRQSPAAAAAPAPQPLQESQSSLPPALRLQRLVGNRATTQLLQGTGAGIRTSVALQDQPSHGRQAARLGALAFTVRDRIHAPPGLGSLPQGRQVIAHELIHAQQWRNGQGSGAPWPRASLESEAHRLAPAMARGQAVTVAGVHRGDRPQLHPIFISTHGRQGYLNLARQFYTRWGYGTPTSVGSIEEMLHQLASGSGPLSKVTLVSHAVPQNINISFLRGGPGFVQESDWAVDSLEELPMLAQHITDEAFLGQVYRLLRRDRTVRAAMGRLAPNWLNDAYAKHYLWWLLDRWFVANQRARGRGQRRTRQQTLAQIDRYLTTYRQLAAVASAASGGGRVFSPATFEAQFQQAMTDAGMRPGPAGLGGLRRTVRAQGNRALNRVNQETVRGQPQFTQDIQAVRRRIGAGTHVEVQGCRIGRQPTYLQAMSGFFNGARVTGPDLFQLFGHVGWRRVRDRDRDFRNMWRRPPVRRAFDHWYPIVTGQAVPFNATWETLAAYLRAGNPLLVGATLHLVQGVGEDAFIAFLQRHGYRLSQSQDLQQQFLDNRSLGQAVRFTIIDWLQERRRGGPMIFRPDPDYWNHIISSR